MCMVNIVIGALVFAIGLLSVKYLPISRNKKDIIAVLIIAGFMFGVWKEFFEI